MQKNLMTLVAFVAVTVSYGTQANAQLFKNARQNREQQLAEKGRASLDHVPLTRIGQAIKDRGDARLYRVAERRGVAPEIIRGKRLQGLENFGAALGGVGSGLGAAADSFGASAPSVSSTSRSSTLPSNFSQRMSWNNYNRNYSSLPYHRSASGY